MTQINDSRAKFEAWFEREYKHLESTKYTALVPHIKYGFWMAYQAGAVTFEQRVRELEAELSSSNVMFANERFRADKMFTEIRRLNRLETQSTDPQYAAAGIKLNTEGEQIT